MGEGVSKKEMQSAATSSGLGCEGHVESSNAAVLAVLGYLRPPSTYAWLAEHKGRAANACPEAGSWALGAQLDLLLPGLPSVRAPQHPRESGETRAVAVL